VPLLQGQIISHSATHITDVVANSFSFALDNVPNEIPQGTLPQPYITVLELVYEVEHDDVHSDGVELMLHKSQEGVF